MELDECKREVRRERARVIEREDELIQRQREGLWQIRSNNKGKARASNASIDEKDLEGVKGSYKQVVEEKKGPFFLISSKNICL